jgi:hypothetical protein
MMEMFESVRRLVGRRAIEAAVERMQSESKRLLVVARGVCESGSPAGPSMAGGIRMDKRPPRGFAIGFVLNPGLPVWRRHSCGLWSRATEGFWEKRGTEHLWTAARA